MRTNETYDRIASIPHGMHQVEKPIPWSATCYGCRPKDQGGMFIRAYYTTDGYVAALATTDELRDGFPGIQHGGIVATYLDEVLWHQTTREDPRVVAMTVETQLNYWKPVPENTQIRIIALPAVVEGRHYFVEGAILLPGDIIATTAKIHYVCLRLDEGLCSEEHSRKKNPVEEELKEIYF